MSSSMLAMTKAERVQMLNADLRAGRIVIPRLMLKVDDGKADAILYAWRHMTQHLPGAGDASP